jgi:hypothetical protein
MNVDEMQKVSKLVTRMTEAHRSIRVILLDLNDMLEEYQDFLTEELKKLREKQ